MSVAGGHPSLTGVSSLHRGIFHLARPLCLMAHISWHMFPAICVVACVLSDTSNTFSKVWRKTWRLPGGLLRGVLSLETVVMVVYVVLLYVVILTLTATVHSKGLGLTGEVKAKEVP